MNELRSQEITPFTLGEWHFTGAILFTQKSSAYGMLVSKNGSTFFCAKELAEEISIQKPSVKLMAKLAAKGFCDVQKQECCQSPEALPTFLMIDITSKCNMNCFYCLRHFEDSGETIQEDKLQDILDFIIQYYWENSLECLDIQPWGGEPTIALDRVIFIRSYLARHGVHANITIQTNGLNLSDSVIQKLEEYDIAVGVSIDGCPEIHNKHRKDIRDIPTFDRVAEGIERYTALTGIAPGTISVVSKMSLPYVEQSIGMLVKDLGIKNLKLNLMHPNSELFDQSAVVTTEEIPELYRRVIRTILKLRMEGFRAVEFNTADRMSNLLADFCPDICHCRGCNGGHQLVSFSREGDIYPCETIDMTDYRLGSIYDGVSLPDMIQQSVNHGNPYFAKKTDTKCEDCLWLRYCRGGCTASARFNGRKPGQIDEKECALNRAVYPELISCLLEEPEAAAMLTDDKVRLV